MSRRYRIANTYSYLKRLRSYNGDSRIRAYLLDESLCDLNCSYLDDTHLSVRIGIKPLLVEGEVCNVISKNNRRSQLGKLYKIVVYNNRCYVALFKEW